MNSYEELKVWQRSHAFLLEVYRKSQGFPREERFGLTAQLRKSALSVPSNLAEGCGRSTTQDFRRFVDYAAGSSKELAYQLRVALDLNYLSPEEHATLQDEITQIQRMLHGLRKHLSKK